jgi:hypothetical protein
VRLHARKKNRDLILKSADALVEGFTGVVRDEDAARAHSNAGEPSPQLYLAAGVERE